MDNLVSVSSSISHNSNNYLSPNNYTCGMYSEQEVIKIINDNITKHAEGYIGLPKSSYNHLQLQSIIENCLQKYKLGGVISGYQLAVDPISLSISLDIAPIVLKPDKIPAYVQYGNGSFDSNISIDYSITTTGDINLSDAKLPYIQNSIITNPIDINALQSLYNKVFKEEVKEETNILVDIIPTIFDARDW